MTDQELLIVKKQPLPWDETANLGTLLADFVGDRKEYIDAAIDVFNYGVMQGKRAERLRRRKNISYKLNPSATKRENNKDSKILDDYIETEDWAFKLERILESDESFKAAQSELKQIIDRFDWKTADSIDCLSAYMWIIALRKAYKMGVQDNIQVV